MSNFGAFDAFTSQFIQIKCDDRWQIYQRLQELMIPCWCLDDGSLQVKIDDPLIAIQVRSIIMQFTANRSQLLAWLEFCWQQ